MRKSSNKKFNPNKGYYVEFYSLWKGGAGFGCDYGVNGASEEGGKVNVRVYKSLDKYPQTIAPCLMLNILLKLVLSIFVI